MWAAYQGDVPVVSRKGLVDEVFAAHNRSAKTVDNTLSALVKDRAIVRRGKGRYALAPATLQAEALRMRTEKLSAENAFRREQLQRLFNAGINPRTGRRFGT